MPLDLPLIKIYHITPVSNLAGILASGGIHSDAGLAGIVHEVIGYGNIKQRRLTEYRIPCCDGRFVGEFVPFYYCPRSPMLFTINKGNTGKPPGSQRDIVHITSTVGRATDLGRAWAISDGNAGAGYTLFYSDLEQLRLLDWAAIRARMWFGLTHQKSAEFLVADFFPWAAIDMIGCHNDAAQRQVQMLLKSQAHTPVVSVKPDWYY